MHELSPNIKLSKDEALDDKDPSSQPNKEDMNNDNRKRNPPTKDISSSSIHPFCPSKFPYTTNLK